MKMKKIVSIAVTLAMVLSLAACNQDTGNNDGTGTGSGSGSGAGTSAAPEGTSGGDVTPGELADIYADMDYEEASSAVYDIVLKEFEEYYTKAVEAKTVSERYAYMAVAEAKLLESGVFLPTTTRGGMYGISRIAPYTVTPVLWGNDADRYHQVIVTKDLITADDRSELKAKYGELKGTGTYEQTVKDYLTEKGYEIVDVRNMLYTSDPATWDVLATSKQVDSQAIVNTYDGLVEYDIEGTLKGALAESWSVSDDGLTWTFKLRAGQVWVDVQGRKVADIVADDFVAGFQHMLDAKGGLESLVSGKVVGVDGYLGGDITDFAEVGVKATDDLTVVYTLEEPVTYFDTMLSYGLFAPMSRTYYTSQGGKFGAEYDAAADDYSYGKTPNNIAYCGPYLVTKNDAKSAVTFQANDSYWNKDNINIKTINWFFFDNTDALRPYNECVDGTIDSASLNTSSLPKAKEDGLFDDYAYLSSTDGTSFGVFTNVNRRLYANITDDTKVVSSLTDEQKIATNVAMKNQHFRLALAFAHDRATSNAQQTGEELKLTSIRNCYTPGTFVSLLEDVTIDINGTATTFKAHTNYGAIVQAQLDADGMPIKAYDPDADDGAGSGDGYDGWYNPANAKAELDKAIEELKAQGLEISKDNPVHVDLPYAAESEIYTNKAQAIKKSIEAALEGQVIVNLVDCFSGTDEWNDAGYGGDNGFDMNYTLYDLSGWGPDYGDPSTYLDTMLPDHNGYMTQMLGIF